MQRTTLTLDDDVAAKLKAEARRTGRTFRDTVNDALRRALTTARPTRGRPPFRVDARDFGEMAPGLSVDCAAELLERIEGPTHR
jgi:hypothetical protein